MEQTMISTATKFISNPEKDLSVEKANIVLSSPAPFMIKPKTIVGYKDKEENNLLRYTEESQGNSFEFMEGTTGLLE